MLGRRGGPLAARMAARLRALVRGPHAHAARDQQAYKILVASLFSSPTSMLLSNTVGALVPVFCWYATGLRIFLALAALAACTVVMRAVTLARYQRRQDSLTPAQVAAFDREYFVGASTYSLTLGVMTYIALAETSSVPSHIITIVCGIAFSSGYVARNAGRPLFVIIQLLGFCAPMAVGLAMAADPFYGIISAYIVLFAVTNVSIVFSLNRNLLQLAAATKRSDLLATSLQRKNVTLDSALNSMTHGLCMFNADMKLEVANVRFLELYGLRREEAAPGVGLATITERLVHSQILTPQSADDLRELCGRATAIAEPGEKEIMTESGQVYVITVEIVMDGGILLLTEDATSRKAAAAQIERMAHCDTLTGLPNRFRFNQVIRASLKNAGRQPGIMALLYVDLDNFKVVNDSMGHEAGDHLLEKVGRRLQQLVAHGEFVARFGGDEFLVLASVADAEAALAIGRRIIDAMTQPIEIDGKAISITTSVGVALAPDHGREPSELLRSADMALYAAKSEGRNRSVLYAPLLAEAVYKRREMELDLREASRTGRLFLQYQPIVDARTNQVRSYEALMRWNHPEKGLIPPSEFIPVAETTGLIVQLGGWALRQACMDAKTWPGRVSVAVNVSAFQFKDTAGLIEAVKDALLISGLDPTRLELEVTESLLIEDQEATLDAIRALHRLGVRFSLDDFGTGYSSLAYLARYPFSKVKIDRSFAMHITSDSPSGPIIGVVCQLAQKLRMRVVVEGIETESQRREIVALGAEQAQGYLFGRPQTLQDLRLPEQDAA